MRWPRATDRLLAIPLLLLAVALAVIGALQYRLLQRVRAAEDRGMRETLGLAAQAIADDLTREVFGVFRAFLAPEEDPVEPLLEDWRRNAAHPELVAGIYVADRDGDTWSLRVLDDDLAATAWPAELESMRRQVYELPERGPRARFPNPMHASIPALCIVQLPASLPPEPMMMRRPQRAIIVQLDRAALSRLTASLAERHLGVGRYDVALLGGGTVLHRPSGEWPDPSKGADVAVSFTPVRARREGGPPPDAEPSPPPAEAMWTVAVRQRDGGLEAAIAAAHRRNLLLAFAALLILGASSVMLIALLRRGERLRAQQAQFVAAMSHELNTPLTVLRVAAENLHDGIANDPERVARYARTISRETANLGEMVNQVLEIAGMNAGASMVAREPVELRAVIDEAVAQSHLLAGDAAIEIDVRVDDDLPRVHANAPAMTRAIQNLLTNAIRHASVGKWIGVRAFRDGNFAAISVEDRGPGIHRSEAHRLFQPFYRGRDSASVRGTGLGLTIVEQIADAHGGTVRVESPREGGAAFVIRLPIGDARV